MEDVLTLAAFVALTFAAILMWREGLK